MPAKVSQVRVKCAKCGKSKWVKPCKVKTFKYCSRECHYASMKVENPVRLIQSAKKTYGERSCPQCNEVYIAKTKQQKYCGRPCQRAAIHQARINLSVEPRPCETCGKVYRPRPNNIGRFCSRQCNFDGQRGKKAPNWLGGRHIDPQGYARVCRPDHPAAAGRGGYVKEHRLVMEEHLGRYLWPNENVHHINGKRDDNRIENLELWVISQPKGQRAQDLLAWAKEIIDLYGETFK
jgi:hypothetical protein